MKTERWRQIHVTHCHQKRWDEWDLSHFLSLNEICSRDLRMFLHTVSKRCCRATISSNQANRLWRWNLPNLSGGEIKALNSDLPSMPQLFFCVVRDYYQHSGGVNPCLLYKLSHHLSNNIVCPAWTLVSAVFLNLTECIPVLKYIFWGIYTCMTVVNPTTFQRLILHFLPHYIPQLELLCN